MGHSELWETSGSVFRGEQGVAWKRFIYIWIYMELYGYIWIYMWIYMDLYGSHTLHRN